MKNIVIKSCLLVLSLCFASLGYGQLTSIPSMNVSGAYDIRMISAPVMQPAFLSDDDPITPNAIITNEQMFLAGDGLALNNRFGDGSAANGSGTAITALMPVGTIQKRQIYADCDDDFTTFQSSCSYLDFGNEIECTNIYKAYLYWTGNNAASGKNYSAYPGWPTLKSFAGTAVDQIVNANQVKFKAPGMTNYATVNSTRTVRTGAADGSYTYFADVTSYLPTNATGGLFWVGNVRSGTLKGDGGCQAGWSLVVIFKPPNCPPRVIKFWDNNNGGVPSQNGTSVNFSFLPAEVPASGNSVSYLGFVGIDGEDSYGMMAEQNKNIVSATMTANSLTQASANRIVFNGGNGNKIIQPFVDDQSPMNACDKAGAMCAPVYAGFVSSQISSYDKTLGTNGNQLTRLPNHQNTLGYDAHHVRLPNNSFSASATSATITLPNEQNGDYSLAMAYVAIEMVQPFLVATKKANLDEVALNGNINYTIIVKNKGRGASLQDALSFLTDTLDLPIDLVPGSIVVKNKTGGVLPTPGGAAPQITGQGTDVEYLKVFLPVIAAADINDLPTDSITITFQAKVKDISRMDIWRTGCRRTIQNKANLYYDTADHLNLTGESNTENGCGGGDVFANVYVNDITLDNMLEDTHHFTVNLGQLVANPATVDIITRVHQDMRDSTAQFAPTGDLTLAEAQTYTVTDMDGNPIVAGTTFDPSLVEQSFMATKDVNTAGYECFETFYLTYRVVKVPDMVLSKTDPVCAATATGKITVTLINGGSGYGVKIVDAANVNNVLFSSRTKVAQAADTYNAAYLKAGKYYALLEVTGQLFKTDSITLVDPASISLSVAGSGTNFTQFSAANSTNTGRGSICLNSPFTLTATGNATDYVWKQSADSVTWSTVGSAATLNVAGITDTTYYWVYNCNSICQLKRVYTVYPKKVADFNPMSVVTCSGTAILVSPSDSISPVNPAIRYRWAAPVNATVTGLSSGLNATNLSATLTNNPTPAVGSNLAKSIIYAITPSLAGCDGASFNVTVNLKDKPSVTYTAPVPVCDGSALVPTLLTVNTNGESISSQAWTLNGSAFNISDAVSYANNGQTLRYTAVNSCGTTNNDVTVTIRPLPTALISNAVGGAICVNSTYAMNATATNGTIAWTHNGTGSFANASLEDAVYTPGAGDAGNNVTLTMTVTSNTTPVCTPAAQATYTLAIRPLPTATISNVAGGAICVNSTYAMNATAANGTIAWTHNGTGSFANASLEDAVYTPGAGDAGNNVTLTMTVTSNTTPVCTPAAQATYTLAIRPLSTATISNVAGGAICVNSTYAMNATAANGTIAWTHNGTGSFANASLEDAVYTPGAGDAGNTVTLTMTVTSNTTPACTPNATATYALVVNPLPTITSTSTFDVCEGLDIQLNGSPGPNATNPWISATTTVATINGSGLVHGVLAGTSVITYLDVNGCSNTATVTVNACTALNLSQTTSGTACQNGTITYTITVVNPSAVSSTGIQVMDALPANVTYVSSVPSQGTYNSGTGIWNVGTVLSTQNATLTITTTATTVGTGIVNQTYVSLENGNPYASYAAADVDMKDVTTVDINPLPTVSITANSGPICVGANASFTLTGTANAVVTYNINGAANTTATLDGAGTATVIVATPAANQTLNLVSVNNPTTSCNQTVAGSSTVTVNPLPTVSITANNGPICVGANASFTLTGTANAVVAYNINGAANTTATLDGAGTATVIVATPAANQTLNLVSVNNPTTSCNQTVTGSSTVTVNSLPTVSITANNGPICIGANASFTLTGTANAVVTYNINGAANTTATLDAAGIATVTVATPAANQTLNLVSVNNPTTSCNQTVAGSSTVTVNPLPTVSITANNGPICVGANASFTLTGTANAVVTYNINGAANTTATLDAVGTATVTVATPAVNQTLNLVSVNNPTTSCTQAVVDNSTVTVNNLPTITLATANASQNICMSSGGTATLADIDFSLGGSATDASVIGLPTGLSGLTTGTTYTISGAATQTGTFNYTVTTIGQTAPCNSVSKIGTIVIYNPITATLGGTDVTINGGTDGTISITGATGGSGAAIEYRIAGDATRAYNASLTGFAAGTYQVYAKNPLETCEYYLGDVTISEPGAVQGTVTPTNAICKSGNTGSLVAEVTSGGVSPYQYQLEDNVGAILVPYGATIAIGGQETFSTLTAGSYKVRVKDANGAISFINAPATTIVVTEPAIVQLSVATVTNLTCNASADGSILVSATGGNGTYEYSNDGGLTYQSSATFSGLSAQSYNLMARDGNLCLSVVVPQALTEPAVLTASNLVTNPLCASVDASTALTVSGGTTDYQYSVDGGATWSASFASPGTVNNLSADVTVSVRDSKGCTTSTLADITLITAITGTLTPTHVSTPSGTDGSIAISAIAGGNGAAIEYRIAGDATRAYNASLTGLPAGTYTVYARNVTQTCEYSLGPVVINEPGAISGTSTKVDVLCNGASTGSISAQVTSGGTANYDFQLEKWNGSAFVVHTAYSAANLAAATPLTFTGLPMGNYQVRVKDAVNYESIIASINLTEKAQVTASALLTNPLCLTGTGSVTLTMAGGTAPYNYNLNTAGMLVVPVGNVVPNIPIGAYTITAEDVNGCTASLGAGMSGTVAATDAVKPTFTTCQGAVTRNATATLCAYTVIGNELDAVAADNCAVTNLTHNYSGAAVNTSLAGETLVNGTSVLWTAVDALGNSHTCTVTLTVVDAQAPTFTTCPVNQARNNTAGQCAYVVVGTEFNPVAADNCAVTSLTHNVAGAPSTTTLAGASLPKGTTTIVWTAKDAANNSTTCTYDVVVSDTELPVLTCTQANLTRGFDANQCTWAAAWTAPTATDNCPGVTVERTDVTGIVPGTALAAGTYTISYRARDLAGNVSADCSFTITVSDTQLPTINCTQNNFTADVNTGVCTWTAAWTVPTASDNCPGSVVERTDLTGINVGDALAPGTYTISYRARDAVNNLSTSSCSFTITVRDVQSPVIACKPNATVSATAGTCSCTVVGNAQDATATDNCLVTSLTHNYTSAPSNTTLAGAVINGSATIIWTASDAAGNSSTCTTVLTVSDTELPTVVLPIANQPAVSNGSCVFTVPDIRPLVRSISSDNCTPRASLSVTQLPVAGTVIPSGTLSVTVQVTVQDFAGMSVTVPVIIDVPTQPATITLDPVAALCKNGAPVALTGSPSGNYVGTTQTPAGVINFTEPLNGTYSGPGVSGAQFNPATLAPGMHTLTYTVSPWGCTKSATVQVEVIALPTVSVNASPVCPGMPMVFTATTSVATTNAWTLNGVADGSVTGNAYTFANTLSGAFVTADVIATESHGCSSAASKTVQVFTQPAAPIANNLVSCKMNALPVQWVTRVSGTGGGTLQWYDSSTNPTQVTPVAIDKSQVGVVSYYAAVKGTNGCLSQRTQVTATINALPVITDVNLNDIKNVQVTVSGAASPFTYTIRERTGEFLGSVNLGLLPFGTQNFVVVDANLCSADSTFEIDPLPLIPDKYFSPNGDGVNETWKVKNIEFYPRTEISIHDRFGKELIDTKGVDFEQGWDGVYLEKLLPSTDYWYVIEIRETGKRMVGHFLLHR